MSNTLEISAEINYEDEAVNWDKNIHYGRERLKIIYREWSFEVANRFNEEGKDVKFVCAHIKGRLKIRGVSDSSRDYVAECLESQFKDSSHDGSANRTYGKDGNPSSSSVYEDLDSKVMNLHYKNQWNELTDAELLESLPRSQALKQAKIKALREELKSEKELADERDIHIPEFEKDSAPIPPEYFHGQSEMYEMALANKAETQKIPNMWGDLAESIYYFKPDQETAAICADKFRAYKESGIKTAMFMNTVIIKSMRDIMTPSTDLKWGDILTGWFTMAKDRLEKYGNKGCGTKHAIPTGLIILKKLQDGSLNWEELLELIREWTREQVGDRSQKQIIQLALTIIMANDFEQGVKLWMDDTYLVEKVLSA